MTTRARSEASAAVGVGQNDARIAGQGARDRDTLGLAAGQLRRHRRGPAPDLEIVEKITRAIAGGAEADPRDCHGECHIVGGVEKRQKIVESEDEADVLAPERAQIALPVAPILPHRLAGQRQPSGIRFEDARDQVEQRSTSLPGQVKVSSRRGVSTMISAISLSENSRRRISGRMRLWICA